MPPRLEVLLLPLLPLLAPRDELWPLEDEPLRPLFCELELDEPLIPPDCELLDEPLMPSWLFWRSAISPFLLTSNRDLMPTSFTPCVVGKPTHKAQQRCHLFEKPRKLGELTREDPCAYVRR
jgi:hypothetical protein